VAKSRFHPLFERVNYVYFHASGNEQELDLTILKHVENFIEQNLLGLTYVIVYVLEHEKQRHFLVVSEVLLNLRNHFHSVELLRLLFEPQCFAELHKYLTFICFKECCVYFNDFKLLFGVILNQLSAAVCNDLADQIMHRLLRSSEHEQTIVFVVNKCPFQTLIYLSILIWVKVFYAGSGQVG